MKYGKISFNHTFKWRFRNRIMLLLPLLLLKSGLYAQDDEWKTKLTRDGAVTVKYRVYDQKNEEGEKSQVIEFEAVTIARASLEDCVSVMVTESNHVEIMEGTEIARRVSELPGGDWIIYYYYKPPWPMPAADIITRYNLEENPDKNQVILTGTPAPDMYPTQDLPRMEHNHTRYTFTRLGQEEVEITMYSWSIPLISAPKWLTKTWFPNGPADMVMGIAEFAEAMGK